MGTVVRFEKQTGASAKASQLDIAFEVQAKFARDSNSIEQVTSACEAVVDCIERLQRSLARLDGLQRSLLAYEDDQAFELQAAAVKSQLSSQLASVAGILRTLGSASEELSRVGSAITHRMPT